MVLSRPPCTSVSDLVARPSGDLARLLAHARHLAELDGALREFLGEPLGQHCRVANVTDRTVTLLADSPAWCSRLRFRGTEVLQHLRRITGRPAFSHIVVRVRPPHAVRPEPLRRRPRLSGATAKLLRSVAAGTEDQRLRNALLRLAERAS